MGSGAVYFESDFGFFFGAHLNVFLADSDALDAGLLVAGLGADLVGIVDVFFAVADGFEAGLFMVFDASDFFFFFLAGSSSSSSAALPRRSVSTRTRRSIGSMTEPILRMTFGAVIFRAAVSGTNVDVTGALTVDSNAATDLNGKGSSLT